MNFSGVFFRAIGVLMLCNAGIVVQAQQQFQVTAGVSEALAAQRKKIISNIQYQLFFSIPESVEQKIAASETVQFQLSKNRAPLQLDFKGTPNQVQSITVNGKPAAVVLQHEHLLIDKQLLFTGINTIAIQFWAGDLSLNRNPQFLYTLLVPDRARTVFPCFDQPDLKARFQLSLQIPKRWTALANAPLQQATENSEFKTYRFKCSDVFATYLFSFVAGNFNMAEKTVAGHPMKFYFRETDTSKIDQSVPAVFQLHEKALQFLETYTGIAFPFQKLDFAAIPAFQYGGMEHVGAIDYKSETLFLDSAATKSQQNARSNLVAHETAHMWFGDLVTMQWFNDVWMKEVFANFMADKITQDTGSSFELKFVTAHLPRAYAVDRTPGANAIRQPLGNLQEAGTLYGPIIYDKAPVMMRQLEHLMGAEAFKAGVQTYLKRYQFSNASWPDLISILDDLTPANLHTWNQAWVNTPGRPLFRYTLQQSKGKIEQFTIAQQGEHKAAFWLPQFFEMALVYPDSIERVPVYMNQQQMVVQPVQHKQVPLYFLFNVSGQGYGLFPVDGQLNRAVSSNLQAILAINDPVVRASAYINWYENMLSGQSFTPAALLDLFSRFVAAEPEELNVGLMTGHITDIYWRLLTPEQRKALAPHLERKLWTAMQQQPTANKKKILFQAFQNIALTSHALNMLYTVWKAKTPPDAIKLSEEDYTALAIDLALKNFPAPNLLQQQLQRISNPDRQRKLQFMLPAIAANVQERDAFFASLQNDTVRKKEAWIAEALRYLHHPLRAATSIKYVAESLAMLETIQQTGDIFFPSAWLTGNLGFYQSKEAAAIVRRFLQQHPNYNKRLKLKILQAADPLFRAEKLVR